MNTSVITNTQTDARQGWIIFTIMLAAILEVMDATIVNVALPTMMPALSANQDQITWILTAYVVASAMMLPLTGFISDWLGRRRFMLICISGFMLASFACGLTTSLSTMVVLRLLQGGFGAALIPLSQSILRDSFPLHEQGKAMAIWGIGIMAAPVFGPTLGGFITEYASWRWIFYLNIPICLAAIMLTVLFIKPAPTHKKSTDWLTIGLMFLGVGCLQIFLDQGNTRDWFHSDIMTIVFTVSILSLFFFVKRTLKLENPPINLRLFANRNFALCTLSLAVFVGCIFGLITLQPIMLQKLFGYTAIISGITLSPSGALSAVGMMIAASIMNRINVKYLLVSGLIAASVGCWVHG